MRLSAFARLGSDHTDYALNAIVSLRPSGDHQSVAGPRLVLSEQGGEPHGSLLAEAVDGSGAAAERGGGTGTVRAGRRRSRPSGSGEVARTEVRSCWRRIRSVGASPEGPLARSHPSPRPQGIATPIGHAHGHASRPGLGRRRSMRVESDPAVSPRGMNRVSGAEPPRAAADERRWSVRGRTNRACHARFTPTGLRGRPGSATVDHHVHDGVGLPVVTRDGHTERRHPVPDDPRNRYGVEEGALGTGETLKRVSESDSRLQALH